MVAPCGPPHPCVALLVACRPSRHAARMAPAGRRPRRAARSARRLPAAIKRREQTTTQRQLPARWQQTQAAAARVPTLSPLKQRWTCQVQLGQALHQQRKQALAPGPPGSKQLLAAAAPTARPPRLAAGRERQSAQRRVAAAVAAARKSQRPSGAGSCSVWGAAQECSRRVAWGAQTGRQRRARSQARPGAAAAAQHQQQHRHWWRQRCPLNRQLLGQ